MPWVQQAILKSKSAVVPKQVSSLSHSVDDTSAALGAALIGEEHPFLATAARVLADITADTERRTRRLFQVETAMATMNWNRTCWK